MMKNWLKRLMLCSLALVMASSIIMASPVGAKSVVEKRLEAVRKDYPNGSRFNSYVGVNGFSGGGCNALVMYATLKIFHNAYAPTEYTFKRVGKTASTSKIPKMRTLFNQAKVGDVIRWQQDYTDSHFAIFLSSTRDGVYVYEANFGAKNKVWYKHFWPWRGMKTWPYGGANRVTVYRSNNYAKVNAHKSAINYGKGTTFTVNGIHFKVTKATAIGGIVKVTGYDDGVKKKAPKQVFMNRTNEKKLNYNKYSECIYNKIKDINSQAVFKVVS